MNNNAKVIFQEVGLLVIGVGAVSIGKVALNQFHNKVQESGHADLIKQYISTTPRLSGTSKPVSSPKAISDENLWD